MRTGKKEFNYQVLNRICEVVSSTSDLKEVAQQVVRELSQRLGLKGAALLLLDKATHELQVAAAYGLSRRYLNKGPLSSIKSIAESLDEGPVAIYNVAEDPRLQYPQEAMDEGIMSMLSVPVMLKGRPMGVLRLYTAEPWEFTMSDLTFVTAIALMMGLALDNMRCAKAYKTSIELLKDIRYLAYDRPEMQ